MELKTIIKIKDFGTITSNHQTFDGKMSKKETAHSSILEVAESTSNTIKEHINSEFKKLFNGKNYNKEFLITVNCNIKHNNNKQSV